MQTIEAPPAEAQPEGDPKAKRRPSRTRRIAMRPRRAIVKVHRWLALVLFAWFIVISITGASLVVHHAVETAGASTPTATPPPTESGVPAALDAGATPLRRGRVPRSTGSPNLRNGRAGVYLDGPTSPALDGETSATVFPRSTATAP